MLRAFAVIAAVALSGCAALNSPSGIFGADDAATVTKTGSMDVVITTKATGDARPDARDACADKSRYARLVSAERIAGTDPSNDRIRWHFACTN